MMACVCVVVVLVRVYGSFSVRASMVCAAMNVDGCLSYASAVDVAAMVDRASRLHNNNTTSSPLGLPPLLNMKAS
jgi:hypothetical protein